MIFCFYNDTARPQDSSGEDARQVVVDNMTGPTDWEAGCVTGKRLGEEHHVITCDLIYFAPRHYATNRQVAVSIPDGDVGIFQ